ncbi:PREDICTED: uncharacterized protein LOC109179787 [Ipomoea nil]|uniref:uncharacterized protein LOC109179787 n=1 Tax=Ipomoea nil TaxID=35883 RepID=UPI000901F47F|nr:PREDICTED: uncharacterized protein LOC109179787 [Ipomoea nil]
MEESWARYQGQDFIDRIGSFGKAIWDWSKGFATNFNRRITYWRNKMASLNHQRDHKGLMLFREAQYEYLRVLQHQNDYWRQRAKQFWLREGDVNSTFFHNSVQRRRQNNTISRLKDENGSWVDKDVELIRSIPIPDLKLEDKIVWMEDEKGDYTVKNCYRRLTDAVLNQQTLAWTKCWKLRLPPKIKAFFWQVLYPTCWSGNLPISSATTNPMFPIRLKLGQNL